ncbi:MAG TPA: hypothetical protein VGX23_25115 [Actinocrinis sp.]|nr:hypothetical protein [Actinocrinis sp.]
MTVDTSGRRTARETGGAAAGPKAARWALTLLCLLAGAGVGLVGGFCHRDRAELLGVDWPVGLVYAFAGLAAVYLVLGELPGLGAGWRPGRLTASGAAAAGWLLVVLCVTYAGPPPGFALKGDVVLADDWISTGYLIGGMLLATVAVYRSWLAVLELRLAAVKR